MITELLAGVEEVSAFYAATNAIDRTDDWLVLKLNEEVGELTQAYLARAGQARDKGASPHELDAAFRAELADVFAHVLLLAHRFGVDIPAEVEAKWLVWRTQLP
ncbi:MAG: pyrophosphatase [Herbiconiux sp.]|nr:MAG: pyrophosphatase [Herbiconiux sp.]